MKNSLTHSYVTGVYMCNVLPTDEDEVIAELGGHGPAVTFPPRSCGPTNIPLRIPPAVIVYVCRHCNPLTVTLAILLVIVAEPDNIYTVIIYICMHKYHHTHIHVHTYVHTYTNQVNNHVHTYGRGQKKVNLA